jgi:hypothetical protein
MNSLLNTAADREAVKSAAWVHYFREFYLSKYSQYPAIHFWNTQLYPVTYRQDTSLDPVAEARASLSSLITYLDYINDSSKPLWVTEFSMLSEECGPESPTYDSQEAYFTDCNAKSTSSPYLQTEYMSEMISDFVLGNKVQKWFWNGAGESKFTPTGTSQRNHSAEIFSNETSGELNAIGKKYNELEATFADTSLPEITGFNISLEDFSNSYTLSITATDAGSGIAEYAYALGRTTGADDLQNWQATMSTDTVFTITFAAPEAIFYVSIKVVDAAGNSSDASQIVSTTVVTATVTPPATTLPTITATLVPTATIGPSITTTTEPTVSPTASPTVVQTDPAPTATPGVNEVLCGAVDSNGDLQLNLIDFVNFASKYGRRCYSYTSNDNACGNVDTDKNAIINIGDLANFAQRYRRPTCAL